MAQNEVIEASCIRLTSDLGAKYAILPGDPARVEVIARYLDNPKFIKTQREYTSWEGYLDGEKILVISTGMGGPSTAMCVEDLYQIGVHTIIRIGTCGGMQLNVESGDLILPTGAIRQDGTTLEYVNIEYPAVSDFDVTLALRNAAQKQGFRYHTGVVQSKSSFYGQHDPMRMPCGIELKNKYDSWIKAGALGSEMECSTAFTVAGILRMRAGAVLLAIWNQERAAAGLSNPTVRDMDKPIKTTIEALRELIKADRAAGK